MTLDYRHGIYILELIVYLPALFMALWMAWHHGFGRSSGWLFFIVFSLIRVIGSGTYLATIANPTDTNLYTTWAVCNSIALSPLTLSMIYLLSRVNDSIQRRTGRAWSPMFFRLPGTVTLVGLILGIVGQTSVNNPAVDPVPATTKAGVILFLVAWVLLCGLILLTFQRYSGIELGEHRLVWAILVCAPLLLVRIIYSVITDFARSSDFNIITGNVTIQLVMAVLEEILITFILLLTGLTLEVHTKAVQEEEMAVQRPYEYLQAGTISPGPTPNGPPPPRRERRRRRGGPIRMLFGYVSDEIADRRR